jgi:hypothetical protein
MIRQNIFFILSILLITTGSCNNLLISKENPNSVSDTSNNARDNSVLLKSIDVRYFYEPYPLEKDEYILQLGACFTILPIPLVENEYPTPAIDLQYKIAVFDHFSINATLSTNFFTNLIHLGPQWSANVDDFSIGIGQNIGTFLGYISMEGQFDNNSAYALFYMPIIRFGYRFDQVSFSVSFASSYIFQAASKVSDMEAIGIEDTWNDFFCTIAFEQPFLKKQLLAFGFSLNYSQTPYQSWLLYNTNEEFIYLPEFFFAFQL